MLSDHLKIMRNSVAFGRAPDGSLSMHASVADLLDRALEKCISAAEQIEAEQAARLAQVTADQLAGSNVVLFTARDRAALASGGDGPGGAA